MHIATIKIIVSSIIGTTAGVAAGAYATKRFLDKKYDDLMTEELATIRLYYQNKEKYPTAAEAAAALIPSDELPETVLEDPKVNKLVQDAAAAQALYQGQTVNVVPKGSPIVELDVDKTDEALEVEVIEDYPEPMNETHSVFVNGEALDPNEFDEAEEALARKNGVPYVITQAEYDINELNHEQGVILTYFAVDTTLVDEDEKEIDDVDNTVGTDNLDKFGRGSGDRLKVYIRNESRGVDYEVLKVENGSYMETVLGLTDGDDDAVSQHSSTPRRHRQLSD